MRPPLCGPLTSSLELTQSTLALGEATQALLLIFNASTSPVTLVLCCGVLPQQHLHQQAGAARGHHPPQLTAAAAAAAAAGVLQISGAHLRHLPALAPGHRVALPLTVMPLHAGQGDLSSLLHVQLPGEPQWRRLVERTVLLHVR